MSEITFESVLTQVRQLLWQERQKLVETLVEELKPAPPPPHPRRVPWKDRSREARWLKENAREYAGQWVALEGDQLIAAGSTAVEVRDAAAAAGVDRPLLVQVENPDGLPFAGF